MELLDIIMRGMDRKRPTVHIPIGLVKAAAAILEKVFKPAPLTRDQLVMMQAGSTCDQTVVEKEFGVSFSPIEMHLQKYLGKK